MQKPHKKNWKAQIYRTLQKNAADYFLMGDIREADRLHFLEIDKDSIVLLIGGGFGYTTFSLSNMCKRVFVLEPNMRQYAFLKQRIEEDGCENVVLQHVISQEEIEAFVAEKVFDAIIVEESSFLRSSSALYETLIRSLKSGGEIYIAVKKRGSFRFARNLMGHLGLQDIRCFIVLPSHRVPMFFLPLYNIGALRYFFHNLFYLVATVPPEKRGKYKFAIGMANVASKMLPTRFLVFLLRMVFLSKAVIAKKVL